VLFRCDAGKDDGLGHVMRCLTLADALRTRGEVVSFCTMTSAQMVGAAQIAARGYACHEATELAGTEQDVAALAGLKRDITVLDGKRSTARAINQLAAQGFTAIIDDFGMTDLEADLVINTGIDAAQDHYRSRNGCEFDLFGPRYNLIDPVFFRPRSTAAQVRRVVVTFGGEDPHNHTRWALETFGAQLSGLDVTVVIGPAHPRPASARAAALRMGAEVIEAPQNLAEYILRSDLAITARRTTSYQLAAAGVPISGIGIEPHQKSLIDAMASRGACLPLGLGFDIDVARAGEGLRRLIGDSAARNCMREAQQALFPAPGASAVADGLIAAWTHRSQSA
jgi:spore coat polysaccharide biosynthesis predicted glycosyltransferase SpsG